ncbi:MAG: hypothetical protein GEU74_08825 [Nitriliruptorales bacterium]|nr:hypothetical protein [Nitriliruptorales bacterium]
MTRHGVLPDHPIPDLAAYLEVGGGSGWTKAMRMQPQQVIDEVAASGLRGRGGAGFPTGTKWRSVVEAADSAPPLVCNAAEGEPGTYKDRAVMTRNPYQVLEGLLIAAHAVVADPVVIATKRRYNREAERLAAARSEMIAAGWTGAEKIALALGPDEYLFGEESALLEVVEGKLPMPRIIPPYMFGLAGTMQHPNPTIVNNVETLAHVTDILARGVGDFRSRGTQEAPGTMVFTVVGDVTSPGVYELDLGTSLATLLDIAGASDVQAIYSGVSNAVIRPELVDLPMDFDSFAEAGTGLGSGGFIVYDHSRCIIDVVASLSRFLAVESCAQCPPCKLHGVEMHERLASLCANGGSPNDVAELRRRCVAVTDGNRCYLPVGHALVVGSALDAFAGEFESALGAPHEHDNPVTIPKIDDLDDDTGAVSFDTAYTRKRLDWGYDSADG